MSWYPAAQEITWICAEFVMELRGFEPATSAVQVSARFSASPLLVLQGLRSKARPWIPLAVEPQQVVPIQCEAADGRLGADAAMRSVPIVAMKPSRQFCCAFV